ncbi:MAG: S8 family serine peptidase [Caldilineaceae bacterium]
MLKPKLFRIVMLVMLFSMMLTPVAYADVPVSSGGDTPADRAATPAPASPRLIVELTTPPLAATYQSQVQAAAVNGKLDANAAAAQAYVSQLQAQQAAFANAMRTALPSARVSTFRDETGATRQATYQIVFNGLSIEPGMDRNAARQRLARLPGVKAVYLDLPHSTQLYTSTALINAPTLWNSPVIGGRANAGAGIKVASVDGGVHHSAPMFNGAGYSYPPGYLPNGLGLTANNNGKIIVSRVYFRPWDPPAPGDENPWPGVNGTSHGVHTASIAAGNIVTATYDGLNIGEISGVAPKAYVMSYRVFYASVTHNESAYSTELIAALEDMVKDGADVVNNSWGGGPLGSGGRFDPLDQALVNAVKAGVFVSMAAGNDGPGLGTGDHPSPEYIDVAASTTRGTFASGRLNITAPTPVDPNLQNLPFGTADFGPALPVAQVINYPFIWAGAVDPNNENGCAAFPPGSLAGKAALISRGICFFSDKVFNAQQAGATFVVIYDNSSNEVQGMSCSSHCNAGEITISSVRIRKDDGAAVVNWFQAHETASELQVNTVAYQLGNVPDRIIDFSSRGPGVGNTLKPDIAAPGVNIVAQGFTEGATGEARHLGFGQVSGTSMAAPHVAGAAALLKQVHHDWTPAMIKSALMSTAKYLDIYNAVGNPAQPLDMGAGRLDLTHAADPGVILNPPSLSFGQIQSGAQQTITVQVRSVATATETYNLSTLYTGDGFTATTSLPGFTVTPSSLTLSPGQTANLTVVFNSSTGGGVGDHQGYVVLQGTTYQAHLSAWARTVPALPVKDVLIIDNDFSTLGPSLGYQNQDYRAYYTQALDKLGYSYTVLDYDTDVLPNAATLAGYRAIVYFTGDNSLAAAGLTTLDTNKLVEYLNSGGAIIAMGQDLAATLGANVTDQNPANFFYQNNLGANWIQDSVTGGKTPTQLILPAGSAPVALRNVRVDLTKTFRYLATGDLLGANETPPVATGTTGSFTVNYDAALNELRFSVTVVPTTTTPITVTAAHIHVGPEGVAGPVIRDLVANANLSVPRLVTDSLTFSGGVSPSLTVSEVNEMLANQLYINVHTTVHPNGEIRGQILPQVALNQPSIDEIDDRFHNGFQDPTGLDALKSVPLLFYPGPTNIYSGTVGLAHRDQPTLERPGTTYAGKSIYTSFGLEGMSETFNATQGITPTTRSELLGDFLQWSWSQPVTATITDTFVAASKLYIFNATLNGATAVRYRWDFGDGSPFIISATNAASHGYTCGSNNLHTVRVEITDAFGNIALGSRNVDASTDCAAPTDLNVTPEPPGSNHVFLPLITDHR